MRKRMVTQGVIALLIGSVGIGKLTNTARLDTHATTDVALMIASGICVGAALLMFVQASRRI